MIRESDLRMLYEKAFTKMNQKCGEEMFKYPNSYVIKLSTNCNLKCRYCYMGSDHKSHKDMDSKLFVNILDQIKDITEKFTIYLHGGEPCLRLDLIEVLANWIKRNEMQDAVTIMLQTNGTLINQKLIELIKQLNINIGISVDGISDDTNNARVYKDNLPSTNTVLRNIEKLKENDISLGIFSVLTTYNAKHMLKMVQYFVTEGITSFVINPLVLWGSAQNKKSFMATEEQVYEMYRELIDWIGKYNLGNKKNEKVIERNLHWWYKAMSEGVKGYMCNCSPCGAGIQTIAIGPTGKVYICDQFFGDTKFLLGDISAFRLEKIVRMGKDKIEQLRNIYSINICKECQWRFVCSGGCTAASYYYNGNMESVAPYCEAYKRIFPYMEMKLQNNQIIL